MSYVAGKTCLACLATLDREDDSFTCPQCGGNLEITYDYDALRGVLTRQALADDPRADIRRWLPLLPVSDASFYPPLNIGGTPLHAPARLRQALGLPQLFLKDDTRNPSASFKDRASAAALAHARQRGADWICAASTGNAGSSMACLCASVGQPAVVFVPATAPKAKVAQLLMFGADVLAVEGTYDDAFDLSLAVSAEYGWYNRNTGTNPYTREGKKTCALEIAEQLGWDVPDRVLVPVGDGNIISGIWKGFRDLLACGLTKSMPHITAVQSQASDAVARSVRAAQTSPPADPSRIEVVQVAATTLADSISVDLPRDGLAAVRAVLETEGGVVTVPDQAILDAMGTMARATGVFAEPAGATAFAGLQAMLAAGELDPAERVVVLVTGNGLKDAASAMRAAGEPRRIEPSLEAVARALQL